MKLPMHRTLVARLTGLFALLLMLFAVVLELLFNAMMERKMIAHYSKTMQRNAYAISQNLSEMIAPSDYEALDENPFIVGEDTLAPYMALIEHITNCNVYLIDEQHRVTGYFDGVVQTMSGRVLPNYIEQTIALGFMGKTPFLSAKIDGETHLTTSMPIMNAKSHVLGVVLLESTLRELGFAQVSSSDILLFSGAVAFALTALLGYLDLARGGQYRSEGELRQYLEASYSKAEQLKTLTDELFRYALVFGGQELNLDMQEYDAEILLEQLLFEPIMALEQHGFHIQTAHPALRCRIRLDVTYFQRVLDNLFDNLRKYADPAAPVAITAMEEDGWLQLCIGNTRKKDPGVVESNKIGLKTCERILAQMGGQLRRYEQGERFSVEVSLPELPGGTEKVSN